MNITKDTIAKFIGGMFVLLIVGSIFESKSAQSNNPDNTENSIEQSQSDEQTGHYTTYEKVIEAFAKGMTNADAKLLYQTMFTDEIYQNFTENDFNELSQSITSANQLLGYYYGSDKVEYDMTPGFTIAMSADDLSQISSRYNGAQITEGYVVQVFLMAAGSTDSISMHVFNVAGEGWKILASDIQTVMGFGTGGNGASIP